MSRIAIVALGVGALCLATTSSALNAYPPLRTGANAAAPTTSPSPAKGAAKAASKLSAADKTFMMNAAKGGMMEVEWGKLAAQNAQNAQNAQGTEPPKAPAKPDAAFVCEEQPSE